MKETKWLVLFSNKFTLSDRFAVNISTHEDVLKVNSFIVSLEVIGFIKEYGNFLIRIINVQKTN